MVVTMREPRLKDYPYVLPPLTHWQTRHLELLGVATPLILADAVYRVSRVVFTNCMAHNLRTPNIHFRIIRDIQASNINIDDSLDIGERIYVSRRGAGLRVFLSEQELEARLVALSFSIVQPELHTVDQQI
jgi:capsular polysaccharide biosynthesis protein